MWYSVHKSLQLPLVSRENNRKLRLYCEHNNLFLSRFLGTIYAVVAGDFTLIHPWSYLPGKDAVSLLSAAMYKQCMHTWQIWWSFLACFGWAWQEMCRPLHCFSTNLLLLDQKHEHETTWKKEMNSSMTQIVNWNQSCRYSLTTQYFTIAESKLFVNWAKCRIGVLGYYA